MKGMSLSKKMLIAGSGFCSLIILAGTLIDMDLNKVSLEEKYQVVKGKTKISIVKVVSKDVESIDAGAKAQYIPFNDQNIKAINRKWKITRILDTNGEISFDISKAEDREKKLVLPFELVGTSQVVVDEKEDQVFDISFLHESKKTIALFRQIGKNVEIIEAKAIFEEIKKEDKEKVEVTSEKKNEVKIKLEGEVSLILERALDPKRSRNVFKGEQVRGHLEIDNDGDIQSFDVDIAGKRLTFDYADINAGGQFSAEVRDEMVSGILTNSGNGGFRIRFATGVLAGAMLNFVTDEELENINIKEEQAAISRAENSDFVVARNTVAEGQRSQIQNDYAIERDDTQEYVETNGFNFNENEEGRDIASLEE